MAAPMPPVPPVTTATGFVEGPSGSAGMARGVGRSIAAHAEIRLFLVARETLQLAQPRAVAADERAGFVASDALIGARFDELPHPQSAGVARRTHRGQRVIGPDDL